MSFFLSQFGCATFVNGGRKEAVSIRSTPPGATVYIDGVPMGIAPFFVNLSRKKRHELKFVMPGHQEETRYLTRTFNWWFLGNLLIGGVPAIIDLAYGNQYKFDSDDLNGVLVRMG